MQVVWRADTAIHILLSVTRVMFAVLLWGIIFSDNSTVAGFTFQGMLSYYVISSFLSQLDQSASVSEEMEVRIRRGTFSSLMVLPVSMEGYYLARTCGKILFHLGFDLLAAVLWTALFQIRLMVTGEWMMIMSAVVLIVLGLVFMVQMNYFLGLLTFRYEEIGTFLRIKNNLITLTTGGIIPLTLFPEAFVKLMRFLPFYYVTYLPSMLLTGRCRGEALTGILITGFWCVMMQLFIRAAWKKYRLKYDGAGI